MLNASKLNVLGDNVFVEAIREKERAGVVRGITTDDKPELGTVLRVGPGRYTESGELIPTFVKPGMVVLFNQYTTTKFNIAGKNYYVLREEDIVAYQ
jgi:chaperonin GroES